MNPYAPPTVECRGRPLSDGEGVGYDFGVWLTMPMLWPIALTVVAIEWLRDRRRDRTGTVVAWVGTLLFAAWVLAVAFAMACAASACLWLVDVLKTRGWR